MKVHLGKKVIDCKTQGEWNIQLSMVNWTFSLHLVVFPKMHLLNMWWSTTFFFFNYHKSHFFRKFHWNFSYRSDNMKIFSININYFHRFFRIFWQFFVTKKLIMSAYYRWCHHFFLFQSTLSRLLGVWEAGGCSNWPLPEKTTLRKPSLFRVKSFFDSQGIFFW